MLIELMELLQRYTVKEVDDGYEIDHKVENLGALIHRNGNIKYFVTDIYNSGMNWEEINIEVLEELKRVCELVAKKSG